MELNFPRDSNGEFTGPDLHVFFPCDAWGYYPQCNCCHTTMVVQLEMDPKFALPHGQIVTNTEQLEVGEIKRWAFGPHANSYLYEVLCAEDGELLVWFRGYFTLGFSGAKWK